MVTETTSFVGKNGTSTAVPIDNSSQWKIRNNRRKGLPVKYIVGIVVAIAIIVGVVAWKVVKKTNDKKPTYKNLPKDPVSIKHTWESPDEISSLMNPYADPCDDFYEFACKGWQTENYFISPDYISKWSVFQKENHKATTAVIHILKEPSTPKDLPALTMAKRYFGECLKVKGYTDAETQKKQMQMIWDKLEDYGGWPILYKNGTWDSSSFNWMKSVAGLKREFGASLLLDLIPFQSMDGDVFDNFLILRAPIGPSDADATEDMEAHSTALKIVHGYKDYIVNLAKELLYFSGKSYFDIDKDYLERMALLTLFTQTKLTSLKHVKGGLSLTGQEQTVAKLQRLLDILTFNDPYRIRVQQLLNHFYAGTGIHINSTTQINTPSVVYLASLSNTIGNLKEEFVANYLHFQLLMRMIDLTNVDKLKAHTAKFSKIILGGERDPPADFSCAAKTQERFHFALSHEFVTRQDNKSAIFAEVGDMYDNLQVEFFELLEKSQIPYLETGLLNLKLLMTDSCIGHPKWIQSPNSVQAKYNSLNFPDSDSSHMQQNIAINKWKATESLTKIILPANISETCDWRRYIGTPSASFLMFSVYIPVGILQPPFYNESWPNSLKYAKLGSIMGHEISHGLAGTGWSEYTNGTNTEVGECLIDQYNDYNNNPKLKLPPNGNITLEENLADNAGLLAAYRAYQTNTKEYDRNDKLFFLGFAQNWCETTKSNGQLEVLTKVHSPGRFRVLGTLQNSKEFADAWQCPIGTKMNPWKKCKVF